MNSQYGTDRLEPNLVDRISKYQFRSVKFDLLIEYINVLLAQNSSGRQLMIIKTPKIKKKVLSTLFMAAHELKLCFAHSLTIWDIFTHSARFMS